MKSKGRFLKFYTIVVFLIIASIDNSALEMAPAVFEAMKGELSFSVLVDANVFLVFVNSTLIWIVSIVAIPWAYYGDKGNRKRLLLYGTLIWSASLVFSPLVSTGAMWLLIQVFEGIGLASIASVGFSIIGDFISPERRGVAMSLWNLTQTFGSFFGRALPIILIRDISQWWLPFIFLSIAGFIFLFLYTFTLDPKRGASETELNGMDYDYVIKRGDLLPLLKKKSNQFMIIQAFFSQIAWGSMLLLPKTFTRILENQGLSENTAFMAGNLISTVFWGAGVVSIVFGYVGDRLHKRTMKARPIIATLGLISGIPFITMMLLLFDSKVDLTSLSGSDEVIDVIFILVDAFFHNPPFMAMFLAGSIGAALFSAIPPNVYAIIIDVNLPEHRGTIYSGGNLVQGIGRGLGSFLASLLALGLVSIFPEPSNFTWSIILLQFAYIPSIICFFLISRHIRRDTREVREKLSTRAHARHQDDDAGKPVTNPAGNYENL
ncbi:MAG: MFS transporter [Promethearchaeota archaeon]